MWRWARYIFLYLGLIVSAPVFAAPETTTVTIKTPHGDVVLQAEIADTPQERARGLMFRDDFGPGDAMLFIFDKERMASFWMKNTPQSLDILYFDSDGVWINSHHRTIPYSVETLPSARPAFYVLEIAAGEAEKLGLGAGAMMKLPLVIK